MNSCLAVVYEVLVSEISNFIYYVLKYSTLFIIKLIN